MTADWLPAGAPCPDPAFRERAEQRWVISLMLDNLYRSRHDAGLSEVADSVVPLR